MDDRRIAEFLGYEVDTLNSHVIFRYGKEWHEYHTEKTFHTYLISPPGTVAMEKAILEAGLDFHSWQGVKDTVFKIGGFGKKDMVMVNAPDLPHAVYEAVKKYLEDK